MPVKSKSRLFAALAVLLILTAFFLLRLLFSHQLPAYRGTLSVKGLDAPVDVFTDRYGVPHVFADNEHDLFFSAGYLIARERLFQMTVISAAAAGELSTLFGRDLLDSDIYLRTWGIPRVARKMAEAMTPEIRRRVQAYCNGINRYIGDSAGDWPVEFKLLGKQPRMWTPATVCGMARLMAHDLQQSWKPEILFGAVAENYGPKMLAQLLPPYFPDQPTIVTAATQGLTPVFSAIMSSEAKLRNLLGANGKALGSNNWVIAGSRTANGQPILANDPHLSFTQPAKWYEMHLKGGRYDVSGVCLPGLPLPVIGQNASCAWGFTNVMADDIDFFVETTDSAHPNQYQVDGEWKDMILRKETIPLPGGKDTTIVIRETAHGPVISDIHPLLDRDRTVVSMSWTGQEATKEIEALFLIGRMGNWDDFTEAVKRFSVPGQNIVYADTAGNIGWRPAVRIPLRKNGDSLIPRDGSRSENDWQGTIPFDQMPYLFNPPAGMIVTANNKTVDEHYPFYISNLWADPSRAIRIRELFGDRTKITVADVEAVQTDQVSDYARELLPKLLPLLPEPTTETERNALNLLRNWDGNEAPDSPGALVFQSLLRHCILQVYRDELEAIGPEAFAAYVDLPMIPLRNLQWTLEADSSRWLDNILTPDYRETRADVVTAAFHGAVKEIQSLLGGNSGSWSWGAVHTVTHPHSLGSVKLLDWLFDFNVGPFPSGGSPTTINNGEYRIMKPYQQVVGPSMRRIVDFGDLNQTRMILPTGQSGLPGSPHYADQSELYLARQYRKTLFDEDSIRSAGLEFLRLVPR
ncbi:MAG: penicillin acylase family protein [Fidelibacterota bacterium]